MNSTSPVYSHKITALDKLHDAQMHHKSLLQCCIGRKADILLLLIFYSTSVKQSCEVVVRLMARSVLFEALYGLAQCGSFH